MASLKQIEDCWNKFITLLKTQLDSDEVEAWVEKLSLSHYQEDKIVISGINQFFCNWIKDHHQEMVRESLFSSFQDNQISEDFKLVLQAGEEVKEVSAPKKSVNTTQEHANDGLNPNYRFENFVNGGNSDIAFAAALAVGEDVHDNKYNPLFVCGDVGLGKTHLIQAVGNAIKETNPDSRIQYSTSEVFTNEVINGIRFQKIEEIRNKYRNVDLLLIDDIQFLENKESTQEEFFHIFNELIQNKKQVIITADRYPREIQNIEDRLSSRFNSGMVAKIGKPDFETRMAIIKNKVEQIGIPISDEIVSYVATAVKSNVRDILGILIHIEAKWSLLGQDISLNMVKSTLQEVLDIKENKKNISEIIKHICNEFNVKITDVLSDKRDKEISKTRQIAMYISREITASSFPKIGKDFGGKNHTSVLQACKKTKEWMENDPEIKQRINSIIRELT